MKYFYRDRNSKDIIVTESSKTLNFFYETLIGRLLLKIFISKFVSDIIGLFMNSRLSKYKKK